MKIFLLSVLGIVLSTESVLAVGSHIEQLQSEFLSKTNQYYVLAGNENQS